MKTLLFAFTVAALFSGCAKYGFEPEENKIAGTEYGGPVLQEDRALYTQESDMLNAKN